MIRLPALRPPPLLVVAILVLTGCGQLPSQTTPSATPSERADVGGDLVVDSIDEVPTAVVRIQAAGEYVDVATLEVQDQLGSGTGFIIDPSGIAVTNNHVVTGGTSFRVWVGEDEDPRPAQVLGVSECSDLAVIDIDGEDFPYLEWFDGDVSLGLDVFSFGYPLGDPEITRTPGSISKENADGESSWASVPSVVEHTATINPGNSGGPLVDENGKVVGINYATSLIATDQYFAIARDEALSVIDRLRAEENVASIGVNGVALADEVGDALGVFVSSVQPGSPAAETGVEPNDVIVELGGLPVGENNTMEEYCNVVRSNPDPEDVVAIEVFRIDTGEFLEGEINGDELETTTVVIPEVPDGGGEPLTYEYGSVEDDSGVMTMDIPTEWSDIDGSGWTIDGQEIGAAIRAAPNLEDFFGSYGTPGVFFGASESLALEVDADGLLDLAPTLEAPFADFTTQCTYEGRDDYEDPAYTGRFDLYTACGGGETVIAVVAASPADGSFIILVMIQAISDADADAIDRILDTFLVVGALP